MQEPLISIICTVKNGEKTIEDTIKSVLAQSFSQWEFIIVDDGSNDSTLEIIDKYSKKDCRIKVVKTKGIGRGVALNLAVDRTNSNYIANIDADDLMHPKRLEIQYELLLKYQDIFLLSTDSIIIYSNEKPKWEKINCSEIKAQDVTMKNLMKNQINHSSVIMDKKKLLKIEGYQNNRKSQYDYELWLRAGFKEQKLFKLNQKLVAKRIHKDQSFERKRLGQLLRSVLLQTTYILKHKKIWLLIFPIGRLILGLLPFRIRQLIVNTFKL